MIVASGWACRCWMKAAMRRIGPSTLVVTVASAEARNDSGWRQSSTRMMPAIVTRTLRSGCLASTSFAADSMLAASVVSICTVSRPGCAAAIWSSRSARRPPTMTVLPAACSLRARARPMPLVEPGMKMVFPEMFMPRVWPAAAVGAETAYRGIRDPWLAAARAPIMEAWTVPRMDRGALADFLRRRREALQPGGRRAARRRRAAGPRVCGGKTSRPSPRCRPTTTPGSSSSAARSRASRCSRRWPGRCG